MTNATKPIATVASQNQIAVVTGAAHGIGLAISRQLAAKGVRVVMADLAGDELATAVSEVQALYILHTTLHTQSQRQIASGETDTPIGAIAFVGDLSQEAIVQDLLTLTHQYFGSATILINNAGGGIIRPFLSHTADTLRATIDRNLWTAIWCCRLFLPDMVSAGYGRIVNIGADSVRNGLLQHAAYNAAKGGVHGLTTGLAREFASVGITVNTVAPCAVNTAALDHVRKVNPEFARHVLDVIPMGRPAEVDEVAAMTVFLTTAEAAFITGQVISVNGGSTML